MQRLQQQLLQLQLRLLALACDYARLCACGARVWLLVRGSTEGLGLLGTRDRLEHTYLGQCLVSKSLGRLE